MLNELAARLVRTPQASLCVSQPLCQLPNVHTLLTPFLLTPSSLTLLSHTHTHTYAKNREFVLSFAIMDETGSFLAERNIQRALPRLSRNESAVAELMENADFKESNLKHSING